GEHNLENALAATTAAWALGADASAAGRILRRFRGIAHRLEPVATIKGVEFINDSKGTNPGATIKALRSFPGKAKILIAGGHDKGSDFQTLAAVIQAEVKHLVLLGETKQKLAAAVEKAGFKDYELVNSLEEAVAAAWSRAKAGDLVLLSPACASWDMFPDFEARGNLFKELVAALKKQHS
ncbi:MAG: UDP-N-acetylmuramoyl-L-alanine--D-glutamate ligase, partial [Firmicutes bacterium]|nr:UDP-N-acetylmuramoyl-L-alanine--D-glutamate ligase [Bacillota bacterium]